MGRNKFAINSNQKEYVFARQCLVEVGIDPTYEQIVLLMKINMNRFEPLTSLQVKAEFN